MDLLTKNKLEDPTIVGIWSSIRFHNVLVRPLLHGVVLPHAFHVSGMWKLSGGPGGMFSKKWWHETLADEPCKLESQLFLNDHCAVS